MFHQELAQGRWHTFTLEEQMGNIGTEVGRAIKWKAQGDSERMWGALERGLELFDLTADDPRWREGGRLRELLRAREVVCDFLAGDNEYSSTAESLDKYFLAFALAARKGR